MRKPTVSAKRNIWGNWNIYLSGKKEQEGCSEWRATLVLLSYIQTGKYTLSTASQITQADLDQHVANTLRMDKYIQTTKGV